MKRLIKIILFLGLTAYVANTIDAQIIKDVPLIKSGITDSYKLYTHYVFPPYAQIDSLVEEGRLYHRQQKGADQISEYKAL